MGNHIAVVIEVLRDLIVDDGNFEGGIRCRNHADEWPGGAGGSGYTCRSKKAAS
jgi:hypothetical protein